MNLGQLVAKFRARVDDAVPPYLWTPDEAIDYANQAVREAAERAKLLLDSTTADVCLIDGLANTGTYNLHPKIFEIESVSWDGRFLEGVARDTLNRIYKYRGWDTITGRPTQFIDPQEKYLTLFRIPIADAPIKLVVYRYPLLDLAATTDIPEIDERYHYDLLHHMEYLAYLREDTETQDIERAERAAEKFTAAFGVKIDANMRRRQRERRSNQVRMNPDWGVGEAADPYRGM